MSNGYMLAIEGTDKAGKHTQVMKIMQYLHSRGIMAEALDFPQYNAFFWSYGTRLSEWQIWYNAKFTGGIYNVAYALDRLQHQPQINNWLRDGKWVILDRYTYSNSFSVAKYPRDQWADKIKFMEDLEFNQLGIIKPDHNIYLYLDPKISYNMRDTGLKQYQNGRPDIHESDFKLLYDTSNVYKQIANANPTTWTIVDEIRPDGTRMNIDEVFSHLRPVIDKLIANTRTRFS